MKWYVHIIESLPSGKERVEKKLGPYESERLADKADMGVNRNLNHERFFTRIVSCK